MNAYTILAEVHLQPKHIPTHRTRHYRDGTEISPPRILQVAKFPQDPGYYLLYLDQDYDELTDTYHDSFERALQQAHAEFLVDVQDWTLFDAE